VLQAGTHMHIMQHIYMDAWPANTEQHGQAHSHGHEQTEGLFLFPSLADQDEGLLVKDKCVCIHIYSMGLSSSWT